MARTSSQFVVTVLLSLVLTSTGVAQYEVDLTDNVPLYGQEECVWCGAACAQMIMNGYPNPADRLFHTQQDIWDTIQANNSTDPADVAVNWATDPEGLCESLKLLNPPPGGTWHVYADGDRDAAMFDVLYWMRSNNYPVATLINRGGHWVVIVGYVSDIEPVAGSSPALQEITKYDPEPHNVGSQSTMDAAIWYATDWDGSIWYAGTWDGKYVSVIEPPVEKGTVKVQSVKRTGDRIIEPEEAVKYARQWIVELKLAKKASYSILGKKEVSSLPPMLVREDLRRRSEEREKVVHYYIVPFGFEREIGECGIRLARAAVIVNAFTGQFEEVGAFGRAVRYLPEEEARNIATKTLGLKREQRKEVKARLMFEPSDISHIRLYPFWEVTVEDRVLYVDQLGKVYGTVRRSVPGD